MELFDNCLNDLYILNSPDNRDDFKKLIKKYEDYKVFVKFSAKWCGPCKKIENNVYKYFSKVKGKKLLILVDIDKQTDIGSYFKINRLPTIITFKEGNRDHIISGSSHEKLDYIFNIYE
jgi:thioredoxin-like negative regulator of GroEL